MTAVVIMKYGTQMESYHQVWTWIPTRGRLTLRMWRFKRQPLLLYSWVAVKAHDHQHLSMETFYSSYSSQLLFYFLSCSLPTGLIWHVALLPSSCPTESSLSSFSSYIQGNPLFYLFVQSQVLRSWSWPLCLCWVGGMLSKLFWMVSVLSVLMIKTI